MDWVHDEVHGLGPQRWSTFCIRPFVCKKKGPKGLTDGFHGGEKSKKKHTGFVVHSYFDDSAFIAF